MGGVAATVALGWRGASAAPARRQRNYDDMTWWDPYVENIVDADTYLRRKFRQDVTDKTTGVGVAALKKILAAILVMMGRSRVGVKAEAMLRDAAKRVVANGGRPVVLEAKGADCIAAAHAYAAEPQLFSEVRFSDAPPFRHGRRWRRIPTLGLIRSLSPSGGRSRNTTGQI